MAGSTNFKIFDENGINIVDDTTYGASSYRLNGAVTGVAPSNIHNKLYRQTSMMSAAIAQVAANNGQDVSDANFNNLVAALTATFGNIGGGSGSNKEIFTANGTFTVPQNITTLYVSGCAGGGGGSSFSGCGGGAGQFIYRMALAVTPGQSLAVNIGVGGSGNKTKNIYGDGGTNKSLASVIGLDFSGNDGGNTTFGSTITLVGGKKGYSVGFGYHGGEAGGTGSTRGASYHQHSNHPNSANVWYFNGGDGGNAGNFGIGGKGGEALMASDGDSSVGGRFFAGTDATGFGGGGGGGAWFNYAGSYVWWSAAGDGAPGIIIVEW